MPNPSCVALVAVAALPVILPEDVIYPFPSTNVFTALLVGRFAEVSIVVTTPVLAAVTTVGMSAVVATLVPFHYKLP